MVSLNININSSYAKSLLHRMSFVKRKGTSSAKITTSEFESVKTAFEVSQKVSYGNIPDS